MSDEIMNRVVERLREKIAPEREGSLFTGVDGNSVLSAHGAIENVMSYEVEGVSVVEYRSRADGRARLDVTNQGNVYDWLRENAGSEHVPGLFRRDGRMVRVPSVGEDGWIPPREGEDDGPAQVRAINTGALRDIIQHRFWCYTEKRQIEKDKSSGEVTAEMRFRYHEVFPHQVAQLAIDGVSEWDKVPMINGVSHTPTLRADGSFINVPGYDAPSGVLYLPDNGLRPLELRSELPDASQITEDWVAWARNTLNYILQDFPFEDPGHKANYVAMLLTPLMRRVIPPPYPMFALNAHQRGSGKSLLAKVARILHGGIHRPDMPTDDEELRKQITSILTTTTAPYVNWDNSSAPIKSGQIANLLTTDRWSDRPLGSTATVEAANDRIWMVTGNNVRLGGDMARRVQWVSIDAKMKNPEYRTGFAVEDLPGYVTANRGAIIKALMVIAGWWVQHGMPVASVRSDDYARWAGGMQEMLRLAGLDEGFGAAESMVAEKSEDEDELEVFIEGIWLMYAGAEWTITDVKTSSYNPTWGDHIDAILPSVVKEKRDPWKSLGRYCKSHEKQFAGDKRLIFVSNVRGGIKWKIEHSA